MTISILQKNDAWKDLDVFDEDGYLKALPSDYWRGLDASVRRIFLHYKAGYFIPTSDSMAWLRQFIKCPMNEVLEVGAGNGWLGHMLGCRMTDSYRQEDPEIVAYYASIRQPVIQYGKDVEKLEAVEAVKKYRPHTVVASWVSEYRPETIAGINEKEMLLHCKQFLFIGSLGIHADKSLVRGGKGRVYQSPTLISRSSRNDNRLWVFKGKA